MQKLKLLVRACAVVCLITSVSTRALEPFSLDVNLAKDLLKLEVQVNESSQPRSKAALSSEEFPTARPDGLAKSLTLSSFSAPYDLYVWQQEGYTFAEAVPTSSDEIYVCSSSWTLVQNYNDFVSAFNSVRFVNEAGDTVCEDYLEPIIFQITQWEFLYDVLADLSQPFNLIDDQNADLAVLVNGGVAATSSNANSGGGITEDLNINILSIDLQTNEGVRDIFLELIYNGMLENGTLTWRLGDAGFND